MKDTAEPAHFVWMRRSITLMQFRCVLILSDYAALCTHRLGVFNNFAFFIFLLICDAATCAICFFDHNHESFPIMMSIRVRIPTILVFDQVGHKPACTVTEAG